MITASHSGDKPLKKFKNFQAQCQLRYQRRSAEPDLNTVAHVTVRMKKESQKYEKYGT
jgi:hypothetical protein